MTTELVAYRRSWGATLRRAGLRGALASGPVAAPAFVAALGGEGSWGVLVAVLAGGAVVAAVGCAELRLAAGPPRAKRDVGGLLGLWALAALLVVGVVAQAAYMDALLETADLREGAGAALEVLWEALGTPELVVALLAAGAFFAAASAWGVAEARPGPSARPAIAVALVAGLFVVGSVGAAVASTPGRSGSSRLLMGMAFLLVLPLSAFLLRVVARGADRLDDALARRLGWLPTGAGLRGGARRGRTR